MNKFIQSSEMFGAFCVFVALFIILVLLDYFYNSWKSHDSEKPTYGHHHSLRFFVKRLIARLLLKLGKRREIPDIDKVQDFSDADTMPVDSVYFNTSSSKRQIVLIALARRKNGLVNTMCLMKVPEFSNTLLALSVHPNTSLYQTEEEQAVRDSYTVAGLKVTPITPRKEYRLEYNGKMILESNPSKTVDVEFNAVWRSYLRTFNFSTDFSDSAMSEAMALEPWTRKYFDNLKSHHQTHFEQFGYVEGAIKIDGNTYSIHTSGLRDHTVAAKRDWNDIDRYVLHFIHLENGDALTIGTISVPVMFSRLVVGFVTKAKDNINIPVDNCSIDLSAFDTHDPPESYEFDFIANNDSYRVHVKVHTKSETIYMGEQSESCLIETWCDFKVNGIKGWGAAEWEFKNERKSSKH